MRHYRLKRDKPIYTTALSFASKDGHSVANFHHSGVRHPLLFSDNSESIVSLISDEKPTLAQKLEASLAYSLYRLGIKEIAGYRTRVNIGTGELFTPDGKSEGATKVFGKGFELK